jgi:hypothetical protein
MSTGSMKETKEKLKNFLKQMKMEIRHQQNLWVMTKAVPRKKLIVINIYTK